MPVACFPAVGESHAPQAHKANLEEDTKWYPCFLYGYLWVMGLERPTPVQTSALVAFCF